jgi:hypothetical protein
MDDNSISWHNTPCSPLKVNRYYILLAACVLFVSCLTYNKTLNMEAKCPSETSVDFQLTIAEDRTL